MTLDRTSMKIDGRRYSFHPDLLSSEDLPVAFQFWMAHVARDLLQLGVFFRAGAIMLQVPGAGRYQFISHNQDDGDDPVAWVDHADRVTVFNVLAECLRRLGAKGLMEQVPGGADYRRVPLPVHWKQYLDRRAAIEHGLLNVVAACLEALIQMPGLAELNAEPRPAWWQKLWRGM